MKVENTGSQNSVSNWHTYKGLCPSKLCQDISSKCMGVGPNVLAVLHTNHLLSSKDSVGPTHCHIVLYDLLADHLGIHKKWH